MDESTLNDLSPLLTGQVGPSTRIATCTALAGYSSGPSGEPLRTLIGATPVGQTIIRRLLVLSGDTQCARVALSALVNLSETESCAAAMVASGAVPRAIGALLDAEQRALAGLYSGLLSNLTRFRAGVDAMVADGRTGRLMAAEVPNLLWMANICVTEGGREIVGGVVGEWVLEGGGERRFAGVCVVRNLAVDEGWHERLVGRVLEGCLGMGGEVVEVRRVLVEALLLLCKSRVGRVGMRERGGYEVLERWGEGESDGEVGKMIGSILDRLAAFEDGEDVSQEDLPSRISVVQT